MSTEKNITKIKPKSRIRRIFSRILNFLCALIIFFVILFSIGAFMQADVESRNILGDYDYQIFSYNKTEDGMTRLTAFGEIFFVDMNKIYSVKERFDEVSAVNQNYTPSIILLSGDIINGCVSSVGNSLKKIPEIIKYFFDKNAGSE